MAFGGSYPLRVALIEGHGLYGRALALVIDAEPRLSVVAQLMRIDGPGLEGTAPDVVLVDLDTHAVDLGETLRICRKHAAGATVCVLTQNLKPEVMQRCVSLSVEGFLAKDMEPADFVHALRSVGEGQAYMDPRVAGGLLRRRTVAGASPASRDLSPRELDIVRFIADGLSNREISARMGLSEKTIKIHAARIFAKFGVTARTQAAVHAVKAGIV